MPNELARNIAKEVTPYNLGEQVSRYSEPALDQLQALMRYLGFMQPKPPPLNAPLPRWGGMDPQGQPIIRDPSLFSALFPKEQYPSPGGTWRQTTPPINPSGPMYDEWRRTGGITAGGPGSLLIP